MEDPHCQTTGIPGKESKRNVPSFDVKDKEVTVIAKNWTIPPISQRGNFCVGFAVVKKKEVRLDVYLLGRAKSWRSNIHQASSNVPSTCT